MCTKNQVRFFSSTSLRVIVFVALVCGLMLIFGLVRLVHVPYSANNLNCDPILSKISLGVVVAVVLLVLLLKDLAVFFLKDPWVSGALVLITAGGLFTLAEYLHSGCVLDYIVFSPYLKLNLSDIAVSVGVLTILLKLRIKRAMLK